MGFLIMLLSLFLQPYAIAKKHVWLHHKNGALIIVLGWVNAATGISLLGLRSTFVVGYGFLVAVQIFVIVFDPLNARGARLIRDALKKQRGESTVVELESLLAKPTRQRAGGAMLRARHGGAVQPSDDNAIAGGGSRANKWGCTLHNAGHTVKFTAPRGPVE
eukprot:g6708.t1